MHGLAAEVHPAIEFGGDKLSRNFSKCLFNFINGSRNAAVSVGAISIECHKCQGLTDVQRKQPTWMPLSRHNRRPIEQNGRFFQERQAGLVLAGTRL
jgi:hypothetical protein